MPTSNSRREAPDRNLAMELVRVTEAAAMAAGRWVGRGDKNGGDGAAVDAMRQLIGSVSMRGIVVIGEGEKDEAPMLFNGEEVGNGEGPWCDVAVDPIDGTTLMAKGMPGSVAVLAVAERGAMFDPSAVFYMEKLAVGPGGGRRHRHHAARGREHPPGRGGEGHRGQRRHGVRARPAPARRPGEGDPPHRRPHPVHLRRRRRGRDLRGPPQHRHRPALRHRRHPGGDHHGGRAEVHGRRDAGAAVAARRRRARARPSTPGTTSTGCSPSTTSCAATTCSSAPPASPTASCCAACTTGPGGARRSRSSCGPSPARCG